MDAFSYNYHVAVPSDAAFDRSETAHKANLFDMGQKYADVLPTRNCCTSSLGCRRAPASRRGPIAVVTF